MPRATLSLCVARFRGVALASTSPSRRGTPRSRCRRSAGTSARACRSARCRRGSRGRSSPCVALGRPRFAAMRFDSASSSVRYACACRSSCVQVRYSFSADVLARLRRELAVADAGRAARDARGACSRRRRGCGGQRQQRIRMRPLRRRAERCSWSASRALSSRLHRLGCICCRRVGHVPGLAVAHRGYSLRISSRFSGREPRRPNTAIWSPVSSTPRSRSRPSRQAQRRLARRVARDQLRLRAPG